MLVQHVIFVLENYPIEIMRRLDFLCSIGERPSLLKIEKKCVEVSEDEK